MNTEDLRRLVERAEAVEGREADRLSEVHSRIRTARRRRASLAGAVAAGLAIAVVAGGAALSGSTDETQDPVDQNTPRPTPTQKLQEPAGQVTVSSEIGPGDIRGWELRGSRTNTQPGWEGATDLSLTVSTGGLYEMQSSITPFCNGDPGTWWVLTMDLGGVDGQRNPDGSMQDGTRGKTGPCTETGPTEVPTPTDDIQAMQRDQEAQAYPMRMFVTKKLTPAARECLVGTTNTDACLAQHALAPLDESDATFGFGVYEHRAGPEVLKVLGWGFEALALTAGVEYLVDRAVVTAPDAARLVVRLPASDRSRYVAVYEKETAALEECAAKLGHARPRTAEEERAQFEEFDARCITELELRVDGRVPDVGGQVLLAPGGTYEVTIDVVKNDPRNVRYALVIWEERS